MKNFASLEGKRILITGASQGIGAACARLCAEFGAEVVLVARNMDKMKEIESSLLGKNHVCISYDLHDLTLAEDIFRKATADGKKLDGFIHAAGVAPIVPIRALNMEMIQDIFYINFFSFLILSKFFLRNKYSISGSIVAISSVAGTVGCPGMSVYGASKGALNAAIKSIALEVAGKGYRANVVSPSNIRTEMLEKMFETISESERERIESKQPLGLGRPEDVASAVVYLLSEASSFITGTELIVDGGYLAQ